MTMEDRDEAGEGLVCPLPVGQRDAVVLAHGGGGRLMHELIESDTAPLWGAVRGLLEAGLEVHCLRDLTRGGLASALVEIAEGAGVAVRIEEGVVPVREDVRGACEVLGLDVLHVANEGRFVCLLPAAQAARALAMLRACGQEAAQIGEVVAGRGQVTARGPLGTERIVDMLSGEQLPRIC
jgi:hydrogenase expression/formation protein HypE